MAKKEQQADVNEKVRRRLKTLVRNVTLVVAIVALGYVAYMLFYGAAPRRTLETIDQTLISGNGDIKSYTDYVQPYVGPGAARPSITELDYFLSFFDASSREFFRKNASALARQQYQFDPAQFDKLNDEQIRIAAMQNLINREPLNGIARVIAQRPSGEDDFKVTVAARNGRQYEILMRKEGNLWRMAYLGGLQAQLEKEIAAQGQQPAET